MPQANSPATPTREYLRGAAHGLAAMLEARSKETGLQCPRVARIAERVGLEMRLSPQQLRELRYGAYLHDIGKVAIPELILHKPGKLTSEEWKIMRTHPEASAAILLSIGFSDTVVLIAAQHHERYDGKGYPNRLLGTSICLEARIFAIADTYDAIVSDRVYRLARSHDAAVKEIIAHSGSQFDPAVVDAFVKIPAIDLIQIGRNC